LLLGVIAVLLAALLLLSVKAFATAAPKPTFTSVPTVTAAQFAIPPGGDALWSLRLWSHGQLLGSAKGTAGTLSVSVPVSDACSVQADVRTTGPGGKMRYVKGTRMRSACCPATVPVVGTGPMIPAS
jgi:hypothetical protein